MKKVLITGTSSGLGLELTKKFIENDWVVVGLSKNNFDFKNESYFHFKTDLSDKKQVDKYIDYIKEHHSDFDLIINNAGMLYTSNIDNYNMDSLTSSFAVNIFSHMKICGDLFSLIKENKADVISITSSSLDGTYPGFLPYSSSKAALRQFTKELQISLLKTKSKVTEFSPDGFQSNIWKNMKGLSLERDENKRMKASDISDIIYFIANIPKDIEISLIKVNNKKQK